MGSLSLLLSLPLGLTLALIGAITTSLNSLGKGVGKGLQEINKTTAYRLDREFPFQGGRTGHLTFCGTHLYR